MVQVLRKIAQEEFEPMRWITTLTLAAAVAVATYACGGPASPSGSGTLNLRITDSPYSDAKAVLVTFSEVSAQVGTEESGRTNLTFANGATTRTCDLKKLENAQDVLGVGPLAAGHYTMVRLVVSSATLYFDNASTGDACAATMTPPDGDKASMTIPSGEVKLNREFDVVAGGATTILLDFDGDRSIAALGNGGGYRMTPVINVVSVQ
jgi:hypothetical protein